MRSDDTSIHDVPVEAPVSDTGISYRRISDIKAQPIQWLWPYKIARGKLTLIAGNPGLGKSQVTVSLAAVVSTGGRWPVDRTSCEPGKVIFLSAEDAPEDTLKPRLMAAGADVTNCYILDAVMDIDEDGKPSRRAFTFRKDMDRLSTVLDEIEDVSLVIIDPISAYLSGTDSHNNAEVRAALAPLSDLAADHNCAFVVVSHLNKGGGTDPLSRVTGSLAFVAAARMSYIVTADHDDESRRLFLPLKNNLAECHTGLAYRVEGCTTNEIETSRISWEAEAVAITADEAMNTLPDDERTETDEAADFLKDLLSQGPVKAADAKKQAKAIGIGDKALRRARDRLGIKPRKLNFSSGWSWQLPPKMPLNAEDAQDALPGEKGILEHEGHLRD